MPCFMLRSTSIHAYMFRSTCLGFYAMFPLFRSSLCFMLMLGLCAYMLDIMSMVMLCSNLCVCTLFVTFYAQIRICTCLYAWIHVLPCPCTSFHMPTHMLPCLCLDLCLCAQIYVFKCLCAQIYALLALCHLPCACVLHAMFVCLDQGYVCLALCYCSPFVALPFFLAFWPIGSDPIQTLWSLSSSIHLGPYQRVLITPICMFVLACFYASCLCQPLLFQALPRLMPLAGIWLCGCIRCPGGYVWM